MNSFSLFVPFYIFLYNFFVVLLRTDLTIVYVRLVFYSYFEFIVFSFPSLPFPSFTIPFFVRFVYLIFIWFLVACSMLLLPLQVACLTVCQPVSYIATIQWGFSDSIAYSICSILCGRVIGFFFLL